MATSMPCPSDYRAGDESDPRSPDFIDRLSDGSIFVEFPWELHFDPPHPSFGESCPCALSGYLDYVEETAPLSRKERAALAAGVDFDLPDPERSYEGFRAMAAQLPDGRALSVKELQAEPGFSSPELEKGQFDEWALEILDAATTAQNNPKANKQALARLRASFEPAPAPTPPKP